MKARISLGLSRLSVPHKIEKARHLVTAMTGNVNFATPVPSLESVTTAVNNLEEAHNSAQGAGPAKTALMYDMETVLDNVLAQLANYVEIAANGNEAVVLSSGMQLRAKGVKRSSNFTVDDGNHSGELVLHTKATKNGSYVWQMVADPLPDTSSASGNGHSWQQIGISTKASFITNNLISGVKYWFRVATVGKLGQGVWSDPISKIVSA
jgi:hypothetical protein